MTTNPENIQPGDYVAVEGYADRGHVTYTHTVAAWHGDPAFIPTASIRWDNGTTGHDVPLDKLRLIKLAPVEDETNPKLVAAGETLARLDLDGLFEHLVEDEPEFVGGLTAAEDQARADRLAVEDVEDADWLAQGLPKLRADRERLAAEHDVRAEECGVRAPAHLPLATHDPRVCRFR